MLKLIARLSIACLALLAISMSIGLQSATAQTPPPPESVVVPWRGDGPGIPPDYLQGSDEVVPTEPEVRAENNYNYGVMGESTRIVFQSWVTDNWDIQIVNGFGYNQYYPDGYTAPVQLTKDAATDADPQLNRGATKIVFVSNRDGDYEIYSMNADGSQVRQLTFNNATDSSPAWSPDGTKVAFDSLRDGNWEIYVMNADGSNQQRLTSDPAYDTYPAWSTAGDSIFWSHYTSTGSINKMSPDGKNKVVFMTTGFFAGDLEISYSGEYMTYDGDDDANGWLSVFTASMQSGSGVIDSEGGGDNSVAYDCLANGFSPDSQDIIYSKAHYFQYQGDYYLSGAEVLSKNPLYDWYHGNLISATDGDWYATWQTTDVYPPSSTMTPISPYTRCSESQWISLNGKDYGGGILGFYDVQLKTGESGSWIDLARLDASTYDYVNPYYPCDSDTVGQTYSYRMRAVDIFWNAEAWQSGNGHSTFTSIYRWILTAQVLDNRGLILDGAELLSNHLLTAGNGSTKPMDTTVFHFGLGTPTEVEFQKDGFLNSEKMQYTNDWTDRTGWWYLHPADDLISDGEFSQPDLSAWNITGTDNVFRRTDDFHAGVGSIKLTPPSISYQNNVLFPTSTTNPKNPNIVEDSKGTLHVIWQDDGIHYVAKTVDGTWPTPSVISTSVYSGLNLVIGKDDMLHAIWVDKDVNTGNYSINHMSKPDGESWSQVESISGDYQADYAYSDINLDVAVDSSGLLHIAWTKQKPSVFYLKQKVDKSWEQPVLITNQGFWPRLDVSADQTVHFVWTNTKGSLVYAELNSQGLVTQPIPNTGGVPVTANAPDDPFDISVDYAGQVHLLFVTTDHGLKYTDRTLSGNWENPLDIASGDLYYNIGIFNPRIIVDQDGALYVNWIDANSSDNGETGYMRKRTPDGAWSQMIFISYSSFQTPTSPTQMVITSDGKFHYVATRIQSGVAEVLYNQYDLSLLGTVEIGQEITIPADMHQPTLSLSYKLGDGEINFPPFVTVVNGEPIKTVISPWTGNWQFAWADLSAFAGQTVSLSIKPSFSHQGTSLLLDEISLTPWLTPFLTSVYPEQYIPDGTKGFISLHGENFIQTPRVFAGDLELPVQWIDDNTLIVEITDELSFGWHDLTIVNPSGQSRTSPGALLYGTQTYLPVISRLQVSVIN